MVTGTGATDSPAISVSGTAPDQRTYVLSSRLSQNATAATTAPLIACSLGRLHVDPCTLSVPCCFVICHCCHWRCYSLPDPDRV